MATDSKLKELGRDPDDPSFASPKRPTAGSSTPSVPTPSGMSAGATRIGMIVLGLTIWLVAIAWPGWNLPGLLLGAAMVSFASFGLMTEP